MAAIDHSGHNHSAHALEVLENEDILPKDDTRVPVTVLTGFLGSKFGEGDITLQEFRLFDAD